MPLFASHRDTHTMLHNSCIIVVFTDVNNLCKRLYVVKHSIIVVFTDTFLCMKMLLEQLHNSKYVVKHSMIVVFTDTKTTLESSILLIDSVANQECQSQITQSQITHAVAHSCCKHPICAREQPETVTLHASSLRKPYWFCPDCFCAATPATPATLEVRKAVE